MVIRKKAATPKTKKPKVKKRYLDGTLEFKNKPSLDYHLELKSYKQEGLIQSFLVPAIGETERNKYGAVKVMVNEHVFDSIMESRYYIKLLREKQAGSVKTFVLQPGYLLQPSYKKTVNGKVKTIRKIEYFADFLVTYKDGTEAVIDVKGKVTDVFAIKKKLFEYVHQDKVLQCVQLKRNQWIDI